MVFVKHSTSLSLCCGMLSSSPTDSLQVGCKVNRRHPPGHGDLQHRHTLFTHRSRTHHAVWVRSEYRPQAKRASCLCHSSARDFWCDALLFFLNTHTAVWGLPPYRESSMSERRSATWLAELSRALIVSHHLPKRHLFPLALTLRSLPWHHMTCKGFCGCIFSKTPEAGKFGFFPPLNEDVFLLCGRV